jgi:hypothetical protein
MFQTRLVDVFVGTSIPYDPSSTTLGNQNLNFVTDTSNVCDPSFDYDKCKKYFIYFSKLVKVPYQWNEPPSAMWD